MQTITLWYIDSSYCIPFEVTHELSPVACGRANGENLKQIVLDTVGQFGKAVDVPEIFMDIMEERDFDRLILTIEYRVENLLLRFFAQIDKDTKILFASHEDGSIFTLFAVNEIFSALRPVDQSPVNNCVWARHDLIEKEFTKVS